LITVADGKCSIVDYKTAKSADSHAEQVWFYALLWSRDSVLNPSGWPIGRLVLSYDTHDEVVIAPTEAELAGLAMEVTERITRTEAQLELRPPPAYPSVDMCPHCAVRHLCDEYWASPVVQTPAADTQPIRDFVDSEVQVAEVKGSRSWAVSLVTNGESALLRTLTEKAGFEGGDRLRLLGVAFGRDVDSGLVTLTMTRCSESFVLSASVT